MKRALYGVVDKLLTDVVVHGHNRTLGRHDDHVVQDLNGVCELEERLHLRYREGEDRGTQTGVASKDVADQVTDDEELCHSHE